MAALNTTTSLFLFAFPSRFLCQKKNKNYTRLWFCFYCRSNQLKIERWSRRRNFPTYVKVVSRAKPHAPLPPTATPDAITIHSERFAYFSRCHSTLAVVFIIQQKKTWNNKKSCFARIIFVPFCFTTDTPANAFTYNERSSEKIFARKFFIHFLLLSISRL